MSSWPLVQVDWVDSNGGGGWNSIDSERRDAENNDLKCATAGWLLEANERYVLVATSRTVGRGEEQVSDSMQIPRVAITRIRALQPGRTMRR